MLYVKHQQASAFNIGGKERTQDIRSSILHIPLSETYKCHFSVSLTSLEAKRSMLISNKPISTYNISLASANRKMCNSSRVGPSSIVTSIHISLSSKLPSPGEKDTCTSCSHPIATIIVGFQRPWSQEPFSLSKIIQYSKEFLFGIPVNIYHN